MSDNIIKIREFLDNKTLFRLETLIKIMKDQATPDAIDFRCSMFPSFNNLTASQLMDVDAGFLAILEKVIERLENIGKDETLQSLTFKEHIDICSHSMENNWPCQLTIPFTTHPIVIQFLPFESAWVVTEIFIDHRSAIQKSYEMFADVFEMDLEGIFADITIQGRD